jgi:hypothetical protein
MVQKVRIGDSLHLRHDPPALCEICSSTCAPSLHENFHTFDNAIVVENTSSQALILASI